MAINKKNKEQFNNGKSKFKLPELSRLQQDKQSGYDQQFDDEAKKINLFSNRNIVITAAIFSSLVILIFFIFIRNKSQDREIVKPKEIVKEIATTTEVSPTLPSELGNGKPEENLLELHSDELEAEYLTFGNFYKPAEDDFKPTIESYELPLNVKIDVSNYYDISRKINLDRNIKQLNSSGYTILNNVFSAQANNFFSIYDLLDNKQIPMLVTGDFLLYYYQNILKQVYKDIEKDVFYQNVWEINKKMFDIADTRYKKRFAETGVINDPILEGERLAAAYFAVALELLKPKSGSFNLPKYLQIDVSREVALIKEAQANRKSPVFLYQKNYTYYKTPKDYKNNSKLYNFYLATKWMDSLFPLYYRSEECPKCILDENDWLINMIAASLIAKDFSDNQNIKNQWAIVYKVISFFSGLRSELTYLHYQDAYKEVFGEDYSIEEIFSNERSDTIEKLKEVQDKITKDEFSLAEGGIVRDNNTKSLLGMRMLQQPYWPDKYIFSQLINPKVTSYLGNFNSLNKNLNVTFCEDRRKKTLSRCRGFGGDIINLIYPQEIANNYLGENTKYKNYQEQMLKLKNQVDSFNINSWHNNNFWNTLSIAKPFLNTTQEGMPIYMQRQGWQEKDINTVLGSWVNLQLPMDKFAPYSAKSGSRLGSFYECNSRNYIEPNLILTEELIANTNMLLNMLSSLKITQEAPAVSTNLRELSNKLVIVKEIIKKELNSQTLDKNDCKLINELVKQYNVSGKGAKEFTLTFANNQKLNESINGVKLLNVVYKHDNKKVFVIGPIFNYQEEIE